MSVRKLRKGLSSEIWQEVTPKQSAKVLGSGTLDVFATPSMALMVESVCLEMIDGLLDGSQTTVGTRIQLDHLAPTPIGDRIHLKAEIQSIEENVIDFRVDIWDSVDLIGQASHRRVIIDKERFMKRLQRKTLSDSGADQSTG
jgi:fluoroacetyl-CoA thioesterase